jgi:hypothetical protein
MFEVMMRENGAQWVLWQEYMRQRASQWLPIENEGQRNMCLDYPGCRSR